MAVTNSVKGYRRFIAYLVGVALIIALALIKATLPTFDTKSFVELCSLASVLFGVYFVAVVGGKAAQAWQAKKQASTSQDSSEGEASDLD